TEMPAGRVTDDDDLTREPSRELHCAGHVVERAGPAAARITDPPVLDVERRDADLAQRETEVREMGEVVRRLPRATVEHDGELVSAAAALADTAKVAELK